MRVQEGVKSRMWSKMDGRLNLGAAIVIGSLLMTGATSEQQNAEMKGVTRVRPNVSHEVSGRLSGAGQSGTKTPEQKFSVPS
jgi:hypothetical protein